MTEGQRKQKFSIESTRKVVPGIVGYLEKLHGALAVEHIKGNPADGQIGIAVCGCEESEHVYDFFSRDKRLGRYILHIDLLDGDVTEQRFKFCDDKIELIWRANDGRVDNYQDIPFLNAF